MIKLVKDGLPINECQKYYVELDEEGNQTMQFDIPLNDTYYHITPESVIQDDYNQWLVKSINQLKSYATIVCGLDMDDWYSKYYLRSAEDTNLQTKTLSDALNYIKPTGWTISNAGIRTIKRTLDLEKCTAYDLLMRAKVVYDIQYDIDTINKVITVIDPNIVIDKGVYVTPELNMKSTNYKGESKSIVTRLYCYGADDITFESINNGKPYVENTSYKGKPICASWTDGRYTNIESLLEDGKKKLAEMSVPTGAYTIDVVDLQAIDERYKNLDMQLRSTVHCIVDPERKIDIIHRIVKKRIYPDEPSQNMITLSNQPRTLDKEWNALKENVQTVRKDGFRHETEIRQTNTEITEVAKKTDENTKGIQSVEEKITPEQLLITVSDSINDGNKLNTMKFVVDINGIKVKNGGIEVYDGSNNLVMYVDEKTKKLVFNGLITASEININDKFKVTKEGNMIAKDGEFSGKITASEINSNNKFKVTKEGKMEAISGNIGGWTITENGLKASYTRTIPNYTVSDYEKIKRYILGEIELTDEQINYLDISQNGYISAQDYVIMKNLIAGDYDHIWYYEYEINAKMPSQFIQISEDRGKGVMVKYHVSLDSIKSESIKNIVEDIRELSVRVLQLETK